ncbi:hypothetical protein CesoFtcFv8_000244 [Champsocephalus esox]|uniref:Uncharacterized protein n=1 Tax=Champsocephalus esox TaxID=159716 RepID=A0AAN8E4F4_9TELE|nr:hypothetical protein CesoFtcFv8_000244 [Champsocephalus esox]
MGAAVRRARFLRVWPGARGWLERSGPSVLSVGARPGVQWYAEHSGVSTVRRGGGPPAFPGRAVRARPRWPCLSFASAGTRRLCCARPDCPYRSSWRGASGRTRSGLIEPASYGFSRRTPALWGPARHPRAGPVCGARPRGGWGDPARPRVSPARGAHWAPRTLGAAFRRSPAITVEFWRGARRRVRDATVPVADSRAPSDPSPTVGGRGPLGVGCSAGGWDGDRLREVGPAVEHDRSPE